MENLIKGIYIQDELNLYLVAKGLKPATLVDIDSWELGYGTINSKFEFERRMKKHLDSVGMPYKRGIGEFTSESFYIGRNEESLNRLVAANNDVKEFGLALGYPAEAVKVFLETVDGERRDGTYYRFSLSRAKQAGVEIPLWLAYICHVPEVLDFVNGNVSETSKGLGETYRNFVRGNNRDLAERVEKEFLNDLTELSS